MIVGSYFDGDDNKDLALTQHNVYGQALGIVVSTCNRYAAFAKSLLEDAGHTDWGGIEAFDHRVVQACHDLLAAAWRFREDSPQSKLPFEDPEHSSSSDRWLDWLRNEVAGWIDQPHLVRSVQLILTNQNQSIGNMAESRLCLDILRRFPDVPWEATLRDAFARDLANDGDEPGRAAAAAENEE